MLYSRCKYGQESFYFGQHTTKNVVASIAFLSWKWRASRDIAVSNYVQDADGNYVEDGTYTYQDLWPSEGVGMTNSGDNVPAAYGENTSVTLDELINTDVTGSEGYNPDGVLKIETSYEEDQKVLSDLSDFKSSNESYNGQKCNCSDFASEGVKSVLETRSNNPFEIVSMQPNDVGKEKIPLVGTSTTPNQLWKDTKESMRGGVQVLKDPKDKVNNSFINGVKGN
ncbi:MAG: hypothetical protein AAF849_02445 [Bacteroidota bacterium]